MAQLDSFDPVFGLLALISRILWRLARIVDLALKKLTGRRIPSFGQRTTSVPPSSAKDAIGSSPTEISILFFCSSAGEYEQILPLAERLEQSLPQLGPIKENGSKIVSKICFFSPSGMRFAAARGETRLHFLFPGDLVEEICKWLDFLKPKLTVVNRWEFWPNFLALASQRSLIWLVNFCESTEEPSYLKRFGRRILLSRFDRIFCIDSDSVNRLESRYGLTGFVLPDSKYDRVLDRIRHGREKALALRQQIRRRMKAPRLLILGSSWPEDHDFVLPVVCLLRQKLSIVVCMHESSEANLKVLERELKSRGLQCGRLSDNTVDLDALVVDRMGILGELYGSVDFAWVGGACHNRVHNILEPAGYNLPIAFGPRYQSSPEAIRMVASGAASVITSAEFLHKWLSKDHGDCASRSFVEQLAGGAEQFCELTQRELSCR